MRKRVQRFLPAVLPAFFGGMLFFQCTQANRQASNADGKSLANTYCSSCHLFSEPALLPKSVWIKKVLPNMATRMGIPMGFPYENLDGDEIEAVMNARIIPEKPLLSAEEMYKIVQYFAENAPEAPLPQERSAAPKPVLTLFKPRKPATKPFSTQNTMLIPLEAEQKLLLGFEDKGSWLYDFKNKTIQKIGEIAASDARIWGGKLYLLDLKTTQAYNLPKGSLWACDWREGQVSGTPEKVIDSLIRPVSLDVSDVNADGKPDFIVCEFGDYLGRLALYLSSPQQYERRVLKNYPGACTAYFKDMNADGKLDITVLMSQGREEICLFLRKDEQGVGYEEKSIAAFPPCYGFNSLYITDVDRDGHPDILSTNGDNADISTALKPYHGIRLFQNDGRGNFTMTWFYPMYGASRVVAADFDRDGHTDLAAIAHFPDFTPENTENFLFFKNNGDSRSFTPLQFPKPLNGRLLTLGKMDVDRDGDEDVLIGNFLDVLTPVGNHYQKWAAQPCDWWVLENKAIY